MAMGNMMHKWDVGLWAHDAALWIHQWDGHLDRLERYASTFGNNYTKQMDMGSIALGSALAALFGLLFG